MCRSCVPSDRGLAGMARTGSPGCRLPPAAPRLMLPRWPRRTVHPGLRCKPGPASSMGCFEPISLPFQPLSCVEPRAAFPRAGAPQMPRWGKPLPEEAAPAGSAGALEPPAGRRRAGAAGSGSSARRGPVPLGGPAAGGRIALGPSPGAGPQHRFNLAFMCHRVRARLLRGGGNAKHLDGGTAAAHGGGERWAALGCPPAAALN